MIYTLPWKGMKPAHITQGFHEKHQGIDVAGENPVLLRGYGVPLCAPENCRIERIIGDTFTPESHENLERGFGVWFTGLETGRVHVYWHTQPILPVHGGQIVQRGKILAFMGNSGKVWSGGKPVPIDERSVKPYAGTHLHWEIYPQGHPVGFFGGKNRIDPQPLLNWNWQPQYGWGDLLAAYKTTLEKVSSVIQGG